MSLVSYSEFQEHRERRRAKILVPGDLTPRDDAMPKAMASHTCTEPLAVEEPIDLRSQGADEDEGER